MNTITNINITAGEYTFPYLIEYIKGNDLRNFAFYKCDTGVLFKSDFIRSINTWKDMGNELYMKNITGTQSQIRLYFPEHSVESYKNVKYALDIYIYMGSVKVSLGSVYIDRLDALAVPCIKSFQNIKYYEYIDVNIIDPYQLIYSDEYEEFRKSLKGEDLNNDCSLLHCSLHVIEKDDDGNWIPDTEYGGCSNMIQISGDSDYLGYYIDFDDYELKLNGNIVFNPSYNDLKLYLNETYQLDISDIKIKYLLSVDGIVNWLEKTSIHSSYQFNKQDIKSLSDIFNEWGGWKDGISFVSTAIISILDNGEWEEKFILKSNRIPITSSIFSKLLIEGNYKIDINKYFDENMNINVINTIQKSALSYNIPDNSKSNIIIPVFYKVRDLGSIVIHPEVIENICINLDAYKANVNSFIIQIEGVKFNEIGTTHAGTIFKIVGPRLPRDISNGTYYILTQDGEMVTSGKYNYEL